MRGISVSVLAVFMLMGCGPIDDSILEESDFLEEAFQGGNHVSGEEKDLISKEVPVWKTPDARVVVKLSWKQGFSSKQESESGLEGTKIDLDLHLIKKHSLEAPKYGYEPEEGMMFTNYYEPGSHDPYEDSDNDGKPDFEEFFRHDDCSFGDPGQSTVNSQLIISSIGWNAAFELDNQWGGDNYNDPEAITVGHRNNKEPDRKVFDDQYLIAVHYSYCTPNFDDLRDTCSSEYDGEDQAYEVDARIEIFIDGEIVPRPEKNWRPADNFSKESQDFKIHPGEIKVIGVIKWDNEMADSSMHGGFVSDAIVTDIAMPEHDIETDARAYKTCLFPYAYTYLVPIWDEEAYYKLVYSHQNPNDENSPANGECY